MMKLAILAGGDPTNVKTWSGTPYHMSEKLLGRFPDTFVIHNPYPAWLVLLRRAILQLTGRTIDIFWNTSIAAINARWVATLLRRHDVDTIFCIANSPLSANLARHFRTIHVSDATVPLMQDYYDEFRRLPRSLLSSALHLDRMSASASSACVYSTQWAAQSAHSDYGIPRSRIHVVPWGCNLPYVSSFEPPEWTAGSTCHLVFIGVDWVRKGGSLAVETSRHLASRNINVKLHVIGASPEIEDDNLVTVHGFLDKRTEQGRSAIQSLMQQGCFLFLPTRQDCSPMVFSEANSFGMPAIASRTGGVPDVVLEGENGHLLPLEAGASDYADLIESIWSDPERYAKLRRSSWLRFRDVLNWDSWFSAIVGVVEQTRTERIDPNTTS